MNDADIIDALKKKKGKHLTEINRLQKLISSIDNLIQEYDALISEETLPNLFENEKDKILENINEINLTDAILYVMGKKPENWWRGAEIKKKLEEYGYETNMLGQKVSQRLMERVKSTVNSQIEKKVGDYPFPLYRLRDKYRNNG